MSECLCGGGALWVSGEVHIKSLTFHLLVVSFKNHEPIPRERTKLPRGMRVMGGTMSTRRRFVNRGTT